MRTVGSLLMLCSIAATIGGLSAAELSPPAAHTKKHSKHSLLKYRGGSVESGSSGVDWRFFVAGGVAAAWSHGITTPIDVIKTKMQTSPEVYKDGVIKATRDIIAAEGVGVLLSGLAPTIVGYGLEGAMKFGVYELMKVVLQEMTPYVALNFFIASVLAGAVASIILLPAEETRIKMVGDPTWSKENLFSGVARIIREDGIFSMFRGLAAMLSKQVPYTMGKQVSFDVITKIMHSVTDNMTRHYNIELSPSIKKWAVSIISAFLTSFVACLFSHPGDCILTATYALEGSHGSHGSHASASPAVNTQYPEAQASIMNPLSTSAELASAELTGADAGADITSQYPEASIVQSVEGPATPNQAEIPASLSPPSYEYPEALVVNLGNKIVVVNLGHLNQVQKKVTKSFTAIISDIYRTHGLAGFFLGLTARLYHVASIITSQLVIYDIMKLLLGLPTTGSH